MYVYDSIIDTINTRKSSVITISGGGGTGKTTLLNTLSFISGMKFTAPTNKAVTHLDYANTSTIHSHLRLKLQPNFRDGGYELVKNKGNVPHHNVLIIDEASMVSESLHQYILNSESYNHLIYVGDHNQLLPVDEENPEFSVFTLPNANKFYLTENLRTDNDILHKLFNDILECDDWSSIIDVLQGSGGVDCFYDKKVFIQDYLKTDRKGNEDGCIGAYANKTVDLYNDICRMMTIPKAEHPIHPDDVLVLQEGNGVDMYNAEHVRVHSWSRDPEQNAYVVNTTCMRSFMTPMDWGIYNKKLEEARQNGINKKMWKDYYGLKESYLEIAYHYSSTLHKLQGSSYNDTYLDLKGLGMVPFDTAKRLVYVGVTRSSGDKVKVLL